VKQLKAFWIETSSKLIVGLALLAISTGATAIVKVYILETEQKSIKEILIDIKQDTNSILCMNGELSRCNKIKRSK
jgi:hypothetical protein